MQLSKTKANFMLLVAAIIWGSGYLFSKQATNAGMHAGTINAIRGADIRRVSLPFLS